MAKTTITLKDLSADQQATLRAIKKGKASVEEHDGRPLRGLRNRKLIAQSQTGKIRVLKRGEALLDGAEVSLA